MKKVFCILSFLLLCLSASAQLHIGAFGSANKNLTPYTLHDFGYPQKSFYTISRTGCGGGYLNISYDINKWVDLRADFECQAQKTAEPSLYLNSGGLKIFRVINTEPTFILPIMGGVHYDFNKLRVYENVGLFGLYRISDRPYIQDFDLGFANCVGVGYKFKKKWSANIEFKYYRGFLDQHNTGSKYFKQPIYNQSIEIAAGITYAFDFKK